MAGKERKKSTAKTFFKDLMGYDFFLSPWSSLTLSCPCLVFNCRFLSSQNKLDLPAAAVGVGMERDGTAQYRGGVCALGSIPSYIKKLHNVAKLFDLSVLLRVRVHSAIVK